MLGTPANWKRRLATGLIVLAAVAFVIIVALGYYYNWGWVGVGPYLSPPKGQDRDFQRGRTLWDWLQLLIVPAVLALAALWFNRRERESERNIADDRQREAALETYLDRMSELLLDKHLAGSMPDSEVSKVARARTLTVLRRLDGRRKGVVLRFLYESQLIVGDEPIIDLDTADLSFADLSVADLQGANLKKSNLSNADFTAALLMRANLFHAKLVGARLNGALMWDACLDEADLR